MDRVKRIESIQAKGILGATPWRMTSSTKKILDAKRFERFWRGLGSSVSRNLGMASFTTDGTARWKLVTHEWETVARL